MLTEEQVKMLLPLKRTYNNYLSWLNQLKDRQPQDDDWSHRVSFILKLMGGISITLEKLGYNMSDDELSNGFVIEQKKVADKEC